MVGYRQFNKILLSSNAKLSDIAKGNGNSELVSMLESLLKTLVF